MPETVPRSRGWPGAVAFLAHVSISKPGSDLISMALQWGREGADRAGTDVLCRRGGQGRAGTLMPSSWAMNPDHHLQLASALVQGGFGKTTT